MATRHQFRKEFNIGDDDLLLLQIGSGFKVKGVDRSLAAMASLPEHLLERTKFMLVGQDKTATVSRLARRLGLAKKLTILPGRDDIPRFLLSLIHI